MILQNIMACYNCWMCFRQISAGEKYSWNGLENDLAHKFSERTLETLDYVLLRKRIRTSLAEIISTEITETHTVIPAFVTRIFITCLITILLLLL
jgi:hypothetical protein